MSSEVKAKQAQFGMIGLAVMGRNLALNVEEHGFPVAVWNLETEWVDSFVNENSGKQFVGTKTVEDFVRSLERPRRMMMMIRAGAPVDLTIDRIKPLLEEGDILIDGGNSYFKDTQRREEALRKDGLCFVGSGVSGGEEGARHGPSLMPGGASQAYEHIRPIFEAIAAKTEAYDILRKALRLEAAELADIFDKWNRGPLESYLIEITANIFRRRDEETGKALVDLVLDKAEQKGTGKWTTEEALELGVPIPTIAAAIDGRVLSSMKDERIAASKKIKGPRAQRSRGPREKLIHAIHDALYASKICSYAQGLSLIHRGSEENKWGVNLSEMARIWKGGCIIRARFLNSIMTAYNRRPDLPNLLLDEEFSRWIQSAQANWRLAVRTAQGMGIPVPAMSASLSYFDSYRTARLPQNLTQAQRDYFGSHTYERVDHPERGHMHTDWAGIEKGEGG
jgi:6-phosphogluconate dehydrogenase